MCVLVKSSGKETTIAIMGEKEKNKIQLHFLHSLLVGVWEWCGCVCAHGEESERQMCGAGPAQLCG